MTWLWAGVGCAVVVAVAIVGGSIAVGTARGRRDSEDSGRPTPVGKRH